MEKITQINRYTEKKDGTPLVTSTGRPYTSVRIKTQEHGDKLMSGFGNAENAHWKVGDEVDIVVEQKGEYLNFSTPKKEDKIDDKLEMILNRFVGVMLKLDKIEALLLPKKDTYPEFEHEDAPPF